MSNTLLIICLVLALLAAGYLGWQGRKFIDRIETLEAIAKRRRLPYPAMAGVEDALALIDLNQFESATTDQIITAFLTLFQKEMAARKYSDARFAQVKEILKTLRSDPQGYDINQPSSRKES